MRNNIKNALNEILINKRVRDYDSFIMTIIPELLSCVSFDQKHPHHHLDVWEHTLLALDNLESDDLESNMALLLHDIGKPFSYQERGDCRHFRNHANVSANIAQNILIRLGYDNEFINDVCYLVKRHDTPIHSKSISPIDYKLLDIQYADAKAHHPDTVLKRIRVLDKIKSQIYNE